MFTQFELLAAGAAALLILAIFARMFMHRRVTANGQKMAATSVTQKRRERRLRCRRTMADRRTDVRDDSDRRDGPGRRAEDQWDDRCRF